MKKKVIAKVLRVLAIITLLTACSVSTGNNATKESPSPSPENTEYVRVIYDANGASYGSVPVDSYKYKYGDTVVVRKNSGNLEYEGYEFDDWNTEKNGNGIRYRPGDEFILDKKEGYFILYAQWTPSKTDCTVSFNTMGHGWTPYSQIIQYGGYAYKPENPSEIGWEFCGWYEDYECEILFDFSKPIYADIVLYAKWEQGDTSANIYVYANVDLSSDIKITQSSEGSIIIFTVDGGSDSDEDVMMYYWKIDGELQSEKSNVLRFDTSLYVRGIYSISVITKKGNEYKSASIYVTVEE